MRTSVSQRIRVNRRTVAWWIRQFGFTLERWQVGTSKYGMASLAVGCYDVRALRVAHVFFF